MLGLADEAFLYALKRAWLAVAYDSALWLRIFPAVEPERALAWHTVLCNPARSQAPAAEALHFSIGEPPQPMGEYPAIFTRVVDSTPDFSTVGMGLTLVRQTVEVHCIANTQQLATALANFASSAIYSARNDFSNVGILGVVLSGTSSVDNVSQLKLELGGAYTYRLRYAVTTEAPQVDLTGGAEYALPTSVHDISAHDEAGNPGRVNPTRRF